MQVLEGTSPKTQAASQAQQEKGKAHRQSCPLQPDTNDNTSCGGHTGVAGVAAEFAQESGIRRESAAVVTGSAL